MSNKRELAKIAKEIEQIKTALKFQDVPGIDLDKFNRLWVKLMRNSNFNYSDYNIKAQSRHVIEIEFSVGADFTDFYSGDPEVDPQSEFISDVENDMDKYIGDWNAINVETPRDRDFDIDRDNIYVWLLAEVDLEEI